MSPVLAHSETKNLGHSNFVWGLAMALLAFLPLLGILVGIELTYRLFYSNPDSFLQLINTWKNFPRGIFSAILLPDTMVFLGKAPWRLWFLSTAAIMSVFYILFVVTNFNLDSRERSRRFFEGILLMFMISWTSDIVGLYWYSETAGPSGVIYSLLGIMYGFIISNITVEVRTWRDSLVAFIRKSNNFMLFSLSLAIGIVFPLYAVANPSGFFSLTLNEVKVASDVHVFCFIAGTFVATLIGILRGRKAFPKGLAAKKAMSLN